MAKSFDELANGTMTRPARRRAKERSAEILAELFLREVRQVIGLSQAELAVRLGIKQPTLSKLESQSQDMQVDTLRRIVRALGGELDVVARFPKGSIRLAEFSDETGHQDGAKETKGPLQLQLL